MVQHLMNAGSLLFRGILFSLFTFRVYDLVDYMFGTFRLSRFVIAEAPSVARIVHFAHSPHFMNAPSMQVFNNASR